MAVAITLCALLTACSDGTKLYGEYDPSSESLRVDLSSERPTFWPRQDDELDRVDRTNAPRINGEKDSSDVIGGDSRKFLLIRKAGSDNAFTRNLTLDMDSTYEGYVFFSNDSPEEDGSDNLVSRDTRLALNFPGSARSRRAASATIISANARPAVVGSSVTIQSSEPSVAVSIKVSSARAHGQDGADWGEIPEQELVSPQGASIGCGGYNDGKLKSGCSGYVTFTFETSRSKYQSEMSVGFDNGDEYRNYLTVSDASRGIWVRFKYLNTGKVDQRDVKVKFDIGSNSLAFTDGNSSPVETDALGRTYKFELGELTDGKSAGDVPVGKEIFITARMSFSEGNMNELCTIGKIVIGATVSVRGFFDSRTTTTLYPEKAVC
uniref:hypothetical protein n=1 Tax=unclassified Rhodococcus (in: high G+C Gram-positive bacteria) TaxID=192944 RepID=UPI00113FD424|nr:MULTISPECIES: hypothetical protein [unclassified Rhodococcus (in: high G+C Gram-positive bacteria)]